MSSSSARRSRSTTSRRPRFVATFVGTLNTLKAKVADAAQQDRVDRRPDRRPSRLCRPAPRPATPSSLTMRPEAVSLANGHARDIVLDGTVSRGQLPRLGDPPQGQARRATRIELDTFNDQRTPPPAHRRRRCRSRSPAATSSSSARADAQHPLHHRRPVARRLPRRRRPSGGQDAEPRCAGRRWNGVPQPLCQRRALLAGARLPLYRPLPDDQPRGAQRHARSTHRFDNIALAARRAGYDPTLFGYTDQSADPTVLPPGDPRSLTYEGVLPGFDVRVRVPEDEKPWLSWLRGQGLDFARPRDGASAGRRDVGKITQRAAGLSARTRRRPRSSPASSSAGWASRTRPVVRASGFLRPHPPFIVPEPYNTMFAPDDGRRLPARREPRAEAAVHPLVDFALQPRPSSRLRRRAPRAASPTSATPSSARSRPPISA